MCTGGEPKPTFPVAIIAALLSLLAAAIPFVGGVLMAMVNLSGGMA